MIYLYIYKKNVPDLLARLHIHQKRNEKYVYVTMNTYIHTIDQELSMVQVNMILLKENHQVNLLIYHYYLSIELV